MIVLPHALIIDVVTALTDIHYSYGTSFVRGGGGGGGLKSLARIFFSIASVVVFPIKWFLPEYYLFFWPENCYLIKI